MKLIIAIKWIFNKLSKKKVFSSVDFKFYDDQISSVLYTLDIPRGVAYSSSLAIPCKWEAYFGRNQRQRSWYAFILQIFTRFLIEIKWINCIIWSVQFLRNRLTNKFLNVISSDVQWASLENNDTIVLEGTHQQAQSRSDPCSTGSKPNFCDFHEVMCGH